MLLGGVFKATGNASPVTVPAKGRWMGDDLARWARRYGVPFTFNPHFPINTLTLMRGAVGLADAPARAFHAVRRRGVPRHVGRAAQPGRRRRARRHAAARPASTPSAFIALVGDPEVKAKLIANTEEAVARGVFGAPTCFVGDQMFFGQDRLDFVREAATA